MHPGKASVELDLADREAVPGMKCTIHVWKGHRTVELWVLGSKVGRGYSDKGLFFGGGGIGLKDAIFSPSRLVLFLYRNQSITLLGLLRR